MQELSNQKEIEELHTDVNKQIHSKSEWWENLSKQTMRIVPDSEVKLEWLKRRITSEQQYKESTEEETPTKRYLNIIKTLKSILTYTF